MDVDGGSRCIGGCDGARHMVMDNGQSMHKQTMEMAHGRGGEMSEGVGQGRKVRDHSLRAATDRHSALAS